MSILTLTQKVNMDLSPYIFPVEERELKYAPFGSVEEGIKAQQYKAIVRADTGNLISIVSKRYKLVRNEEVLSSAFESFDKLGIKYEINGQRNLSHLNYVGNNSMKLCVVFPDLYLYENSAPGIQIMLAIHNSYNAMGKVSFVFGMLRLICSNGATIFRDQLRFSSKHLLSLSLDNVTKSFDTVIQSIPYLEKRILIMGNTRYDTRQKTEILMPIQKEFPAMYEHAKETDFQTQWELYNVLTEYVSHHTATRQHAKYFHYISNLFSL